MVAIRPQAGQTARELAKTLTAQKVAKYLEDSKETSYVNLHLPKFTDVATLSQATPYFKE